MTLKSYAAIMTGAFAMTITILVLWNWTQMELHDVIAVGAGMYCISTIVSFAAIEGIERRKKRNLAATIVTLVKEEWEHGEKAS